MQPFTQFYTLDVGEQDPTRIVGGAQDNGCNRSYSTGDPTNWNTWACADGLETLISFENQNVVYGCSQYGSCVRSLNGGDSASAIGATISQRRNWLTPLVFDPEDADVMYYAGNIVNRSTNGGQTWSAISPDLTGGDPYPEDAYPFGTVTTVAAASSNPLALYAGTDDGRLWYTTSGGSPWSLAVDPDLPDRWVTRVAVDPVDAAVAYVTFSGFRNAGPDAVRPEDDRRRRDLDRHHRQPAAGPRERPGRGRSRPGGGQRRRRVPLAQRRDHLAPRGPRPARGRRSWTSATTRRRNRVYAATFGRGMWKVQLPGSFASLR